MANLFEEEPTYITEEELKDSTRIKDETLIGTDGESARKILIRKAEIAIDSVIGTFGTKVDPVNQVTIFPTVENSIPTAIKKAVVLLCEAMFLGGELDASGSYVGAKWVKSETHGDHKVEFQAEGPVKNQMSKKNQYISQEIETLIKPFVKVSSGAKWSKGV